MPSPDHSPPRGLRRGPPLSVETDVKPTNNSSPELPLPLQSQLAPPLRADTIAYERSPATGDSPLAERGAKRQSRLNFRLFSRNKSTKTPNGQLSTPDEEGETVSPDVRQEDEARAASVEQNLRSESGVPKVKGKSGKGGRGPTNADVPPLFEAYPQAVLEGHLAVPAMDAEAVIRLNRTRQTVETEISPSVTNESQDLSPSTEQKQVRNKINKRRTSTTLSTVACVSKIYILTKSGWLLQYAEEGCHNRIPERIMQLGKDSAAFASDAIPGKHWVLQISQSATEEGAILDQPKTSVLSKLSFGNDMKKPISNVLLVMNSADEMNSWLVTIRKEIQSLGGLEYRPDEKAAGAHTPPQLPPTQLDHDFTSSNGQRKLGHRASMDCIQSPPGAGMPPSIISPRPLLGMRQVSTASSLSHRASMYAMSPTGKYHPQPESIPICFEMDAKPLGRSRTVNLDKELPARPPGVDDAQARIDALNVMKSENLRQYRAPASGQSVPLVTRSPVTRSPISPKFPVSAYNRDARRFQQENASLEAVQLRRFSWEKSPRSSYYSPPQPASRTSHETSVTGRTRATSSTCPSLTDGESAPHGSISDEFQSQEQLVPRAASQPSVGQDSSPTIRAFTSDTQSTTEQGSIPLALHVPAQVNLPSPSLVANQITPQEVSRLKAPEAIIHLQPPPFPVPNSNLPTFSLGTTLPARPSSAQDNPNRSNSPSNTISSRRPSSCQPPTPGAEASFSVAKSCGLPVDKPLTIRERRRLTNMPITVVGPPTLPPPTSPLPALPSDAGDANDQDRSNEPTTIPANSTPPDEDEVVLAREAIQEPSTTLAVQPSLPTAKPKTEISNSGHSPRMYQGEETQNQPVPLSPVSESWGLYLNRIGAS